MTPECPMCGGDGFQMGTLGNLDWFRCRNCGVEWSEPAVRESTDEEDDDDPS